MGCALSRDATAQSTPLPGVVPAAGRARCKLVLLGDSGVGKSCLVQRQCRGTFNPDQAATVGAAFLACTVAPPGGPAVKLEVWDTAGQERFESLAPLYYRGATAAAVVFDITSQQSFRRAQHWVGELQRNAAGQQQALVLVGNKADLEGERAVSRDEALKLANSHGMLYIETSARTGANVRELFERIAERVAAAPAAAAAAAQPPP